MATDYKEAEVNSITLLTGALLSRNRNGAELSVQEKAEAILQAHDIYKMIRKTVHSPEEVRAALEEKSGKKFQVFVFD